MKTRLVVPVLIALAVLAGIFAYKFHTISLARAAQAKMVRPTTTVSATPVREETWPNTIAAVGGLASYRGVTIKTEIEGLVRRVAFSSGATVTEGQPIVELDDSVEAASLPGLEAQARLANTNLLRARELRAQNTNSPVDLDAAEATAAQTAAAVDQLKATLAKKHISAPFPGRLGIALVYPGQFLAKGEAVVRLETMDPIYADFSLPQQDLARVAPGQAVSVTVDAYPDHAYEARVVAIAPRVNDATRTVDIRAELANPGERLRPGMFARIEVVLPATPHALVLPSTSVVHNPYGETVYVIEDGVAHQRFIRTGPQRGDLVQITQGLKTGETVVTSGQIKLHHGSPVRIDNSLAPLAEPAPKPKES
ncbi:MAG TPA: efflux RND transporter periplasmic adaptor subunit [Opitutaceae bacterium]|nr:efflux RND transporter periplasmic adaptor subunit [Opitutaceae bacterium]HND61960.1 efflux RND transporter periplasmic adaptor subunit [Opitutaceae bacterium]